VGEIGRTIIRGVGTVLAAAGVLGAAINGFALLWDLIYGFTGDPIEWFSYWNDPSTWGLGQFALSVVAFLVGAALFGVIKDPPDTAPSDKDRF